MPKTPHSARVEQFVERLKDEHLIYHDPNFVQRVAVLASQFEAELIAAHGADLPSALSSPPPPVLHHSQIPKAPTRIELGLEPDGKITKPSHDTFGEKLPEPSPPPPPPPVAAPAATEPLITDLLKGIHSLLAKATGQVEPTPAPSETTSDKPSAADLDAVAAERSAAEATAEPVTTEA